MVPGNHLPSVDFGDTVSTSMFSLNPTVTSLYHDISSEISAFQSPWLLSWVIICPLSFQKQFR